MGGSPSPSPVVAPPVVDKDVVNREANDLAMRRRGRAANQLVPGTIGGDTAAPAGSVAVTRLLGGS